jgi:hypothetical protein
VLISHLPSSLPNQPQHSLPSTHACSAQIIELCEVALGAVALNPRQRQVGGVTGSAEGACAGRGGYRTAPGSGRVHAHESLPLSPGLVRASRQCTVIVAQTDTAHQTDTRALGLPKHRACCWPPLSAAATCCYGTHDLRPTSSQGRPGHHHQRGWQRIRAHRGVQAPGREADWQGGHHHPAAAAVNGHKHPDRPGEAQHACMPGAGPGLWGS